MTAQKREQRAIDTPISLTALDASALIDYQVGSLVDLQFVSPGVRDGEQFGVNRLFIRGIGLTSYVSGADPSSGFYVDGVYVGRPTEQLNSMYDLDRVEVLRGPQGTLYGRNSTGGAVNITTSAPTAQLSGYIDETAGNYDLHQTEAAISGPLNASATLLGRLAVDLLNHGGYGEDEGTHHPINDANKQNARATGEFKPDDRIDLKVVAELTHEADNDYYTTSFGAYPGFILAGLQGPANPANASIPAGISISNSQNVATALPDITNRRTGEAVTSNLTLALSDALLFESITGWRQFQRWNANETDDTSAGLGNALFSEWTHQLSQEFQTSYHTSRWDTVGGLYGYYERIKNYSIAPFPQLDNVYGPGKVIYTQSGTMPIKAIAAYGQSTYSIEPGLRVTLGARLSSEQRHAVGYFIGVPPVFQPLNEQKTWRAFTPKLSVEYSLAHDSLIYASAANGFKSGTFDVGQANPAINPEKIWAYEIGVKSELFDRRLAVTTAAFYYDYRDLQVSKIIGIDILTVNAAAAADSGLELTLHAKATNRFTVDVNATYLRATFTNFTSINPVTSVNQNLAGNMLPGAPEVAAGLALAYDMPLPAGAVLTARSEAEYTSRIYFSEFNVAALSQAPVTELNASLRYISRNNKWTVTLWGKNLTNQLVASNKIVSLALWGYPIYGAVQPPATYGLTLGYTF